MGPRKRHPRHLPRLVTVDMGFTIIVLRRGLSVTQHTSQVYRAYGRIPDRITDQEIRSTIAMTRKAFEGLLETERDRELYWHTVNTRVLDQLSAQPHLASKLAKDVRVHYLSDGVLCVSRTVLHLVRKLRRRGVRVVIASNAPHEDAVNQLDRFKLIQEFDAIYTSDQLRVRKPRKEFWEEILRLEGMGARTRFLHIGNSLYSDSGATQLTGAKVHIVDTDGRYAPHDSTVQLSERFSEEQAAIVRKLIENGTVRFARSRNSLQDQVLGNPDRR